MIQQSECLNYNLKILKILGFFQNNENRHGIYTAVLLLLFCLLEVCLEIILAFRTLDRFKDLTKILFLLVSHISSSIKFISVVYKSKLVHEVLRALNGKDYNFYKSQNEYEGLIRRSMQKVKRDAYTFFYSSRFCVLSITMAWFFDNDDVSEYSDFHENLKINSTNILLNDQKRLVLNCWLPYDYSKRPVYEITNVFLLLAIIYICEGTVAVDTLWTGLIQLTTTQIDILAEELKKLGNERKPCKETFQDIKNCVQHHLVILDNFKKIQNGSTQASLVQVLESAFLICIIVLFMQMTGQKTFKALKSISFLLCILFEIFLYCHYGTESDNLATAVYLSNWHQFECGCFLDEEATVQIYESLPRRPLEEANVDGGAGSDLERAYKRFQSCYSKRSQVQNEHRRTFQQNILFIMCRMKKTTNFTTGKLFILSYETFVSILKTGYSYYAVLNSTQQ